MPMKNFTIGGEPFSSDNDLELFDKISKRFPGVDQQKLYQRVVGKPMPVEAPAAAPQAPQQALTENTGTTDSPLGFMERNRLGFSNPEGAVNYINQSGRKGETRDGELYVDGKPADPNGLEALGSILKYTTPGLGVLRGLENTPEQWKKEGSQIMSAVRDLPNDITEMAGEGPKMALEAAGNFFGGLGGAATGPAAPVAVPAGIMAGQAAGGFLGEKFKQYIGEPMGVYKTSPGFVTPEAISSAKWGAATSLLDPAIAKNLLLLGKKPLKAEAERLIAKNAPQEWYAENTGMLDDLTKLIKSEKISAPAAEREKKEILARAGAVLGKKFSSRAGPLKESVVKETAKVGAEKSARIAALDEQPGTQLIELGAQLNNRSKSLPYNLKRMGRREVRQIMEEHALPNSRIPKGGVATSTDEGLGFNELGAASQEELKQNLAKNYEADEGLRAVKADYSDEIRNNIRRLDAPFAEKTGRSIDDINKDYSTFEPLSRGLSALIQKRKEEPLISMGGAGKWTLPEGRWLNQLKDYAKRGAANKVYNYSPDLTITEPIMSKLFNALTKKK